jgi:hypothetical protein
MTPIIQSLFDQLSDASASITKYIDWHKSALARARALEYSGADDMNEFRHFIPGAEVSLARANELLVMARARAIKSAESKTNQHEREAAITLATADERELLNRVTANLAEMQNEVTITGLQVTAAQSHLRMLEAQVALVTQK